MISLFKFVVFQKNEKVERRVEELSVMEGFREIVEEAFERDKIKYRLDHIESDRNHYRIFVTEGYFSPCDDVQDDVREMIDTMVAYEGLIIPRYRVIVLHLSSPRRPQKKSKCNLQ